MFISTLKSLSLNWAHTWERERVRERKRDGYPENFEEIKIDFLIVNSFTFHNKSSKIPGDGWQCECLVKGVFLLAIWVYLCGADLITKLDKIYHLGKPKKPESDQLEFTMTRVDPWACWKFASLFHHWLYFCDHFKIWMLLLCHQFWVFLQTI